MVNGDGGDEGLLKTPYACRVLLINCGNGNTETDKDPIRQKTKTIY